MGILEKFEKNQKIKKLKKVLKMLKELELEETGELPQYSNRYCQSINFIENEIEQTKKEADL